MSAYQQIHTVHHWSCPSVKRNDAAMFVRSFVAIINNAIAAIKHIMQVFPSQQFNGHSKLSGVAIFMINI